MTEISFVNESDAIAWLISAGFAFAAQPGKDGFVTWNFSMAAITFYSQPSPVVTIFEGEDRSAEEAQRLITHRPRTFLEAVNMLATQVLGGHVLPRKEKS